LCLEVDPDDAKTRVSYVYPGANLGDWNGCVALFRLIDAEDETSVAVGKPLASARRRAFRKVLANRPSGSVSFSARSMARFQDGCYTFVLLLDSLHEKLGWRCLARTAPFCLAEGEGVPRLIAKLSAHEDPVGGRRDRMPQDPAVVAEEDLGHALDVWLKSSGLEFG
jgi:hypothetical protein